MGDAEMFAALRADARHRAARRAQWAEEAARTGRSVEEVREAFYASPEGSTRAEQENRAVDDAVAAAPPATPEQLERLRAIFAGTARARG